MQIIWDAEHKKWVNKDSDETETESFKPPPKISDMMAPVQMPTNNIPNQVPNIPSPMQNPAEIPINTYGSSPNNLNASQGDNINSGPAAVPSLQSNMFKMQRNKSKNNYH